MIFYKKISKGEVKFVCVKCKVSFDNENQVNIHFKRVHEVKKGSLDSKLVQNVNDHVQSEYEQVQNEREHVQSEHKALQTFNKTWTSLYIKKSMG